MTTPARTSGPAPLRVGVVGLGCMGQVHSRAYLRLLQHYPDAPLRPDEEPTRVRFVKGPHAA